MSWNLNIKINLVGTIVILVILAFVIFFIGKIIHAWGATESECLSLDSTHVKIIELSKDCYWVVGVLADQGFVVTHIIATDSGSIDQNQVPGIIIMQNQGHLQISAQSMTCRLVGKVIECLPT